MFSGNNADYQVATIVNDGFWPDVEVADFERRMGMPAHLSKDLINGSLLAAMSECNRLLTGRKESWQASGIATASDVPGPSLGPQMNAACEQYRLAVYNMAKADLLQAYQTTSQRAVANNGATDARETRDSLLATSRNYINGLSMRGRLVMGLI